MAVCKLFMKPQSTPTMLNEIVKLPPASAKEICFIKLAASVRKPGQGFTLSQNLANQEL
jgi:hypothetical protein